MGPSGLCQKGKLKHAWDRSQARWRDCSSLILQKVAAIVPGHKGPKAGPGAQAFQAGHTPRADTGGAWKGSLSSTLWTCLCCDKACEWFAESWLLADGAAPSFRALSVPPWLLEPTLGKDQVCWKDRETS